MRKKLCAILLGFLLTGAAPPPASASLYGAFTAGINVHSVRTLEIYRSDPWSGGHPIAPRPDELERSFASKITIVTKYSNVSQLLYDAMRQTHIYSSDCHGETASTLAARWAVVILDDTGRKLSAAFFTEDGACVAISDQVYAVDPNTMTFLRRTFSFMNY